MTIHHLPVTLGVLGLIIAFLIYRSILRYPQGSDKVVEISDAIHTGAMAFMRREYSILFVFAALVTIAIWVSDLGQNTAIAFIVGALCSSAAGYIGMYTATRANVRTTVAAHEKGRDAALNIAFMGGSIMGLTVAAMGLLGLGALYLAFGRDPATANVIHGFGMGASCVALFSRVGGGIYTKSADVGADLVGKIEAGIPEDDPRNPGVIADNVGDNVGDVAGMGSDIFESYCGSIIATIAISATLGPAVIEQLGERQALMFLPLGLASTGIVCSILGILLVKTAARKSPATALRIGTFSAAVIFIAAAYLVVHALGVSTGVWASVLAGAIGGIIIGLVTEYYTGGSPVRKIATVAKQVLQP